MENKVQLSNYDEGPWKSLPSEQGCRKVEVDDFESFFWFVNRGFGDTDARHIWRGQRDAAWEVVSSLARTGKNGNSIILLGKYQRAVARCTQIEYDISRKGNNSEETKLRLWSLGQHHGLLTPLMDWTLYPYVALFFAFAEASTEDNPRAIFALSWDAAQFINSDITNNQFEVFRRQLASPPYSEEFKQYLVKRFKIGLGEHLDIIYNSNINAETQKRLCSAELDFMNKKLLKRFVPSTNENPRIHGQGGMHIYTSDDVSIETWIRQRMSEGPLTGNRNILTKILMPNEQRTAVLRSLNKMNINYLSLFPDFEGAARHCNMSLYEEHRWGLRDY